MRTLTIISVLNFVLLLICAGFLESPKKEENIQIQSHFSKHKTLEESIRELPREKLIYYTFAVEEYHRKAENLKDLYGGKHDYIYNLSDEDLLKAILEETKEHPEIASIEKLDHLSNGDLKELAKIDKERNLRAHFKRLPLEKVRECAVRVETIHALAQKGQHFLSEFDKENKETLINYIVKEIDKHPQLASGFESICHVMDFNRNNIHYMEETKLKDIMYLLSKKVLRAYCLVFEKYDMEHNPGRVQAMEKYLVKLKKRQLIAFLNIFLGKYPELDTILKLEEKRFEYDIGIN